MRYESKKTEKGNVGVSYESQELADEQARLMDANNCTDCADCIDCIGCRDCRGCTGCTGCPYCTGCTGCYNCTDCTGCYNCTGCTDCTGCYNCADCTGCYNCTGCRDCTGSMIWRGPEAENLTSLNGLTWPVSVSKTHMQIGCQNHSHHEWATFSDGEIESMESRALDFWREWKPTLMAMCEWKARSMGDQE